LSSKCKTDACSDDIAIPKIFDFIRRFADGRDDWMRLVDSGLGAGFSESSVWIFENLHSKWFGTQDPGDDPGGITSTDARSSNNDDHHQDEDVAGGRLYTSSPAARFMTRP